MAGDQPPFTAQEVETMSQATSPSTASRMAWRGSAACGVWHAPPSPGSGTSARRLAPDGGPCAPVRRTMWWTDMTATCTRQEGQVAICIAVDHDSAECMGMHAAKQGTRFEALEPSRQGVRTAFGACGKDIAQGLVLRHDHGSQYMSHVF